MESSCIVKAGVGSEKIDISYRYSMYTYRIVLVPIKIGFFYEFLKLLKNLIKGPTI